MNSNFYGLQHNSEILILTRSQRNVHLCKNCADDSFVKNQVLERWRQLNISRSDNKTDWISYYCSPKWRTRLTIPFIVIITSSPVCAITMGTFMLSIVNTEMVKLGILTVIRRTRSRIVCYIAPFISVKERMPNSSQTSNKYSFDGWDTPDPWSHDFGEHVLNELYMDTAQIKALKNSRPRLKWNLISVLHNWLNTAGFAGTNTLIDQKSAMSEALRIVIDKGKVGFFDSHKFSEVKTMLDSGKQIEEPDVPFGTSNRISKQSRAVCSQFF